MKHTIKYNLLIVTIILLTSASCTAGCHGVPSPRALRKATKDFINNHLLAGNLTCTPYAQAVTDALEAKKEHRLTPALLAAAAFPPLQRTRTIRGFELDSH